MPRIVLLASSALLLFAGCGAGGPASAPTPALPSQPAASAATAGANPTLTGTAAPGGSLTISVGSIDEQASGPEVACSLFDYGGGDTRWQLAYAAQAQGGLVVSLTVPATGQPFMTARKGDASYAADGTGGSQLEATVDDGGAEVQFAADGKDFGGDAIHLQAKCTNVTR